MLTIDIRTGEYALVHSRSPQAEPKTQLFDEHMKEIPMEDSRFEQAYLGSLIRKPSGSFQEPAPQGGEVGISFWRFPAAEIDVGIVRCEATMPTSCYWRDMTYKALKWVMGLALVAGFIHYRQVMHFGGW